MKISFDFVVKGTHDFLWIWQEYRARGFGGPEVFKGRIKRKESFGMILKPNLLAESVQKR